MSTHTNLHSIYAVQADDTNGLIASYGAA